jgi:transposase
VTLAVSAYTTISKSKSKTVACYVTVIVNKDRRPDLRQYRQLLGTLDPAGIPLVSSTLAGNGADDPLYVPTWHKLVSVIGHKQFVYIADCKAASQGNRAQIDAAGCLLQHYSVSLSRRHL